MWNVCTISLERHNKMDGHFQLMNLKTLKKLKIGLAYAKIQFFSLKFDQSLI